MAVTAKNLAEGQLADAAAAIYTATNVKTIIDAMTLTNTDTGALVVSIYLVASAGSASASNILISSRSIAAGESYRCPEVVGHVLNTGGMIQGVAGTAAKVTYRISGREVSGV